MFAQSHDSVPPAPGVDADDAIALVVAAAEKDLQFEGFEFLKEAGEVLFQFLLDFGLGGFRLRLAQFHHNPKVFELLFRLKQRFDLVPQGIGLVNDLLGLLAVVPELLSRHQGIDFAQAFLRAGHVKETSADGPAWRWRRSIRL